MKWDEKGALEALEVKECSVCEQVKPIECVVTFHGKKDLHFSCCSEECVDIVSEVIMDEQAKRARRGR